MGDLPNMEDLLIEIYHAEVEYMVENKADYKIWRLHFCTNAGVDTCTVNVDKVIEWYMDNFDESGEFTSNSFIDRTMRETIKQMIKGYVIIKGRNINICELIEENLKSYEWADESDSDSDSESESEPSLPSSSSSSSSSESKSEDPKPI